MTYSIDINELILDSTPINHQTPIFLAYLQALGTPMQYLNNEFFQFVNGCTASFYATSSTYNYGDIVKGNINVNNNVFISITSSNHNNGLTNSSYWNLYNNTWIGALESAHYTSNKMTFEWALNRQFNTTFRQNTGVTGSALSDIYINDRPIFFTTWYMAIGTLGSGFWGTGDRDSTWIAINGTFSGDATNFTINIPTAVFSSFIGGTQTVTNFADKINSAGLSYTIGLY